MALETDTDFKQVNRTLPQVAAEASDIQIGAVELKDGGSDVRQAVELDVTKNAALVKSESLASEATLTTIVGQGTTSTVGDGRKVVAVATTAEPLVASSTPCKRVVITALSGNTDAVVVGAATVVAALATRRGTPIEPGDSFWFPFEELADVYIDAVVNGEGVSFTYFV